MKPMKPIGLFFSITFTILIFVCPVLEILKLELFNRTNGALKYDTNVEYTYLVLSLIAPSAIILVYFFQCNAEDVSPKRIKIYLVVYLLCSIGIATFTIHELGDIPFNCPKSYNYATPQVQSACKARAANFVILWLFISFLIVNTILYFLQMSPLNESIFINIEGAKEVGEKEIKELKKKPRRLIHPLVSDASYSHIELGGERHSPVQER